MTKILIIEDHADIRGLLRMTLESLSFDICEARDGQDGLNAIILDKPDLVLLDIMMPGAMDGIDVCRRIKSSAHTAHIKVVLLSARGHRHDVAIGKAAGADDYLIKPFSPARLLDVVEGLMRPA